MHKIFRDSELAILEKGIFSQQPPHSRIAMSYAMRVENNSKKPNRLWAVAYTWGRSRYERCRTDSRNGVVVIL